MTIIAMATTYFFQKESPRVFTLGLQDCLCWETQVQKVVEVASFAASVKNIYHMPLRKAINER
jgi:hypothetical protein